MARVPDRDIGLLGKVVQRAIIAVIVDKEKVANPKSAVVFQKVRQSRNLVAHSCKG